MRLTKRGNAGNALKNCEDCEIKFRESCCSKRLCLNALINKLAAYEDADEQGLLVRLPQKTVYAIGWGEGKNCDHVCPAKIDGVGLCSLCDNGELIVYEEECRQEHLPHLGKTVFLTRAEAEAALKGGHDDGQETRSTD